MVDTTKLYGVTTDQMNRLRVAEKALDAVKREISDTVLTHVGFGKGDLVVDTSSGFQYRVDSATGYIGVGGHVTVTVWGRRVWKSGRKAGREARSSSVLYTSFLEKVNVDG